MLTGRFSHTLAALLRMGLIAALVGGVVLSIHPPPVTLAYSPADGAASSIPTTGFSSDLTHSLSPLQFELAGASDNWWAAAQERIRQSEYQVTWQELTYLDDVAAAYQAPNRTQNLRTYFTAQGIRMIPRVWDGQAPPWEWGLALSAYGYAGREQETVAAALSANGSRIEYRRGSLTEWYQNDERGLEQGFTLYTPPAGSGRTLILDLALSGSLRPHLTAGGEAIEFATSGGVTVLRYDGLAAWDASGRDLPARFSLSQAGIRIHIDAAGAVYPITVDPLASTPAWSAESNQSNAFFGYSVATAGDVNGDGYSDVIVGAPYYDNGQTEEGRAFVYHGSASGLSATANWSAEGDQDSAYFGSSVGMAGDVDGDGYVDVIVGASRYDNGETDEGRVFVYHGSASGLSATAAWTAESDQDGAYFGFAAGTAGDVNGDGYSDVIVGAYLYDNVQTDEGGTFVYHGSASGLSATPAWSAEGDQDSARFGYAVGTACDVNGDGYSDVIIGAHLYDNDQTDEGRAYVYHGSASGLAAAAAWSAESDQENAEFGYAVGTAGDVNGDGYSDVIIGAHLYDNDETDEGRAFVYHGSAGGLAAAAAWSVEGDQESAEFGYAVGAVGDVNGDGYGDVIVGAPFYDNGELNEGQAAVYHGSVGGLSTVAAWTVESDQASAGLGYAVGAAGDVNGDGYSDVIVGAHLYDNGQTDEGRTFVYHGGAGGLAAVPAWAAESNQDNAEFGYAVGAAGDVNGDGYADVIVGAHRYDNGQTDEGRVFVYHGSASGLSATAAWMAESDQANAFFGHSVATAGDVNGDGYSDVIIGANRYDSGETDEGAAAVYHGSASGLSATPAWSAEGDQAGAYLGISVGTAGDVDGDGYADVIVGASGYNNGETDEGRVYVYRGSASGLSVTPAWSAESNQAYGYCGFAVGTAGDVNGDGYSDVIVGTYLYDGRPPSDEGQAAVYHGSASGLSAVADWTVESNQLNARLGFAVGTAGDVNGDGYSDVIVGAYLYDGDQTDEGRAYVYHGGAGGLSAAAAWTAEGDQESAEFGFAVGTAGDVNGDGYADVIVGARLYDSGQTDEGRAFVYHGSAGGLSAAAAWTAESDQESAEFGYAVGAAGDVNGDGYGDVIVGVPYTDNGQTNEGAAIVTYGNGGDGLHLRPRQLRSDGAATIAHLGMSDSRTAFQLSLIGRMPLGRQLVRMQWQVAPLGVPITSTTALSGTSAWTDVLTTGVEITQAVTALTPGTPYHWRVRLLYEPGNALGQPAGRWVAIPWNGWNEADLRAAANLPPVASAGPDQEVSPLALVTLDGSASSDPDGDLPLAYAWTQSGGLAVTLSDPTVVSPTFAAPANATVLTFTLVVTDSLGLASVPDQVVIKVGNQAPVADAGPDQAVGRLALVTLDGSASSDADGDLPLAYAWAQSGGPAVALSDPAIVSPTFTAPGNLAVLTFTLTVTDSLGLASTPDQVVITVSNQAPAANAGPDQAASRLAVVTLDGSASSDPDGDLPLAYAWAQSGGPEVVLSNPAVVSTTFSTPAAPAVLTFTLVVTDALGLASAPDQVVITVTNQAPAADAGPGQAVSPLALVTLDGSASSDPDGDLPLAYAWTQSGGPAVTLSDPAVVTPTFNAPASETVLTFTLTVTDSLGLASVPDQVVIKVGNQAPVADAGLDQVVSRLALVTLDGSASSDADGNLPLAYGWTQSGGPAVALSDPAVISLTFTAPASEAVLTFTLVVTDSLGLASAPDQVVIAVGNLQPVADAGPDQAVSRLAVVALDGSASADPDGDLPLAHRWVQSDGPSVILSNPTAVGPIFIAPSAPAVLTFTLVVTDALGLASAPDQVVITVTNQPPAADAGPDQTVSPLATVTLNSSASNDPDGDLPLAYAWTQSGGPAVTLSDPTAAGPTFAAPANTTVLIFTLVVTDSLGLASEPDQVVIVVQGQDIYLPLVVRQ
ncbi:MAG: FG-GAP repeat protein [Anaerolineae bacterium]|nr:FG-GAP repeat protein [Anaerolineae bacterium]